MATPSKVNAPPIAALVDERGLVLGHEKGGRIARRHSGLDETMRRPIAQVALSGEIGAVDGLAGVIAFVHQGRWTGALHCDHEPSHLVIEFAHGDVTRAHSNHPRDRLGTLLLDYGLISREALAFTLAERDPRERIGEALVARRLITADEALLFLEKQVEEVFAEALELQEGLYWFERRRIEEATTPPAERFSTTHLLHDTTRRLRELRSFRGAIPSPLSILVRRTPRAKVTELEADLGRVLLFVDGRSSVKDIARRARLGDLEATRRLYHLMERGFVELSPPSRARQDDTLVDDFDAMFASISESFPGASRP